MTSGVTVSGTVNPNQFAYYKLNTPQNKKIQVSLNASSNTAELYTKAFKVPTVTDYDRIGTGFSNYFFLLNANESGSTVWYFGARASGASAVSFSLQAILVDPFDPITGSLLFIVLIIIGSVICCCVCIVSTVVFVILPILCCAGVVATPAFLVGCCAAVGVKVGDKAVNNA